MKKSTVLIAGVLTLAACSGPASSAATSSTAPPTLGTVSSVDDLKSAYVEAGGTCDGVLDHRGIVKAAADSAWCPGGSPVLSIYLDHDDAKASADGLISVGRTVGVTVIVGDNWLVNVGSVDAERAEDIASRLGGQLTVVEKSQ